MFKIMVRFFVGVIAIACVLGGEATADSEFLEKFRRDYSALDMDLLNNPGELVKVKDFVYQKDVATFTFKEGIIHLLRYVDGRPTTAVFVGKGHARIEVPSHVERQALLGVTGDSLVDEDFEVAFIRMADDFDLLLKERFLSEPKQLPWKTFTIVKQAQGEVFFRPRILHTYDNYFQLLRSHYERAPDGFFWMDFNRYVFTFDPNRPEQVVISYEMGVADLVARESAAFQRRELGITDDKDMSRILYPTAIIEKSGTLEMTGLHGENVEHAEITVKVMVYTDSLRFMSLFLPPLLIEDSIYVDGRPAMYHRRKDFAFIGLILPEYYYRGDTLDITLWYHGKNTDLYLPYVENPQPSPHRLTFIVPKGYNYYASGMSAVEPLDEKRDRFTVAAPHLYHDFCFYAYTPESGVDTVPVVSDIGITLNFLRVENIPKRLLDCYISDEQYEQSIVNAFNYLTGFFGAPPNSFEEYIVPEGAVCMPGLIQISRLVCANENPWDVLGGFDIFAGTAVARQWFGPSLQPATDRERWLADAAPLYLGLMFVQNQQGAAYYANLLHRRDSLYTLVERDRDMPLATGERATSTVLINKGVWLLHMLRFLMYDLETGSEEKFLAFLRSLSAVCNTRQFTNKDIIELAERQYGEPLDWFFRQWLYGQGLPEFKVEYKIERTDGEYIVRVNVRTKGVPADFSMPVVMRIADKEGNSTFFRKTVSVPETQFELGPFSFRPDKLIFNEFFSVLSKDKVKKK
jgi:hypothetical protein